MIKHTLGAMMCHQWVPPSGAKRHSVATGQRLKAAQLVHLPAPWYRWPIEIDGLPFLIAWWIFPWRTVSHNQRVLEDCFFHKLLSSLQCYNPSCPSRRLWVSALNLFFGWRVPPSTSTHAPGDQAWQWTSHAWLPKANWFDTLFCLTFSPTSFHQHLWMFEFDRIGIYILYNYIYIYIQ